MEKSISDFLKDILKGLEKEKLKYEVESKRESTISENRKMNWQSSEIIVKCQNRLIVLIFVNQI